MNNLLKLLLALFVVACSQPKSAESDESTESEENKPTASLERLWASDTTLSTAESVFFDAGNNVLYVSCIGGVPPNAQDEDGFIAKISPEDGSIVELNWVTGIDAPKGMGMVGETLYVANIDEVVLINTTSGEVTERISVPDATFLNDITTDDEGNVYISDSNRNRIHKLSPGGEVSVWIEDSSLGGPNGLFHDGDRMMLATFGAGNFSTINYADSSISVVADSINGGDGIVKVDDAFLVSNWNGEVYYVSSEWEKELILDTKEMGANAADIEFIASTNTLLVPTFFGNQVVAYKLNK
ncbi:MAG: gluconolaconase [Marinoscillum sp.]